MKKSELFSFRTTEQNLNYLKLIAESDDRSQSYILNKMIDEPLKIVEGRLQLPNKPGLGVDLNRDFIEAHLDQDWK